ncbi:WXG100 family type VII secretion target [Solihabitans fulvus]|uniref:WXG100 family type VII secretion target n=1 Tax=Solihabitans fulvus TaxID=1892852 RepID=A0A5B2XQ03_9PSEU|nr:WXG100 family type VII secretion target [Solihabitans fulvus]
MARRLGVLDPVEEHFAPVLGKWNDLHEEAGRWRDAAKAAEDMTDRLAGSLGGLDAAWQGADADSFVAYIQKAGLAGHDMSDAMSAMADALDHTADAIRSIVRDLADVLADAAESVSGGLVVPLEGDGRARRFLDDLSRPTREHFEAARDVLEAFGRLCSGVHGERAGANVTMKHKFPEQNWAYHEPAAAKPVAPPATAQPPAGAPAVPAAAQPAAEQHKPDAPAAAAPAAAGTGSGHAGGMPAGMGSGSGVGAGVGAGTPSTGSTGGNLSSGASSYVLPPQQPAAGASHAAAAAGAAGAPGGAPAGGGAPMGGMPPMGGGHGGKGGGDTEHKSKARTVTDPTDLFGKPEMTVPPVLGDDRR